MSRTSRELVANVLNMFKKLSGFFFSPKYVVRLSCNSLTTFVLVSRTCCREILANSQCENLATLVQMSYNSRTTVFRKHANTSRLSSEAIKLSDSRTNGVRDFHECLATVVRMKMKINLHSWERRETLSGMSCHCRICTTVARLSRDSRKIYFQN